MTNEKMINENTSDAKNGKVIAIVANKGGTGKSTLALHFSYYLQKTRKKEVLLIEFDANGTLSSILGAEEKKAMVFRKIFKEIYDNVEILSYDDETFDIEKVPIETLVSNMAIFDVCVNHNEKYELDFIGSSLKFNLSNDMILNNILTNSISHNIYYLSRILDFYRKKYDFIVIDCNNSIDMWWTEVLVATDYCFSPFVGTENPDVTKKVVNTTKEAIDEANNTRKSKEIPPIKFLGFVANRCNVGTGENPIPKKHLEENRKIFGKTRLKTEPHDSSRIGAVYPKPLLSQEGAGEKPARPLKKLFNEIYEKIK